MSLVQYKLSSVIGPLFLVASPKGLRSIHFEKQEAPVVKSLTSSAPAVRILAQAVSELKAYFGGGRRQFDIALDCDGTPFQRKVWQALSKIPYGETRSYRDIASAIGKSKAFRAVGTANGRNPVCIIVPCHRVIAADGSLGGYTGGLDKKTKLLRLEERASA